MAFQFFRRSRPNPAEGPAPTTILDDSRAAQAAVPECPPAPRATSGYVTYSWLVDPKKHVVGYRMSWRPACRSAGHSAGEQLQALVTTIAESFVQRQGGWCMGKTVLMLDVTPETLAPVDWSGLPAANVVLCWQREHLVDPNQLAALQALREQGFGIMLCGASEPPEEQKVCDLVTHFDVGAGDPVLMAVGRNLAKRPVQVVATRMDDWAGFDACAARRMPVLVSPSRECPPPKGPRQPLKPESVLIVRLLQMLQRNEDVREIEVALKHDAALTYRLLRHINSPAISAGVEIESLRHAVSMLGYSRLFRWLSLLLATSDAKSAPPFLMKKAIMRGRFVELLGQALLGPRHSDNLFLVGMFSVIDQVLGIPMAELLEKVQLAEPVQKAILERSGMYGPLLALALTCESDASDAEQLTEQLFVSASQVNTAHLEAITWSQEVSRSDALY